MARLSQKELENATQPQNITKHKQEKELVPDDVSYTMLGRSATKDEQGYPTTTSVKDTFARKILRTKGYDYFVMIGPQGRLFDPFGLLSSAYKAGRQSIRGKSDYKLVKVNKQVFDYYLRFLKTKNAGWIRDAERHM